MKTKTRRRKKPDLIGKPDRVGWFWHVHHAERCPMEWCWSYQSRYVDIVQSKEPCERTTRLLLLKPVVLERFPAEFKLKTQRLVALERVFSVKCGFSQDEREEKRDLDNWVYSWLDKHRKFIIREHARQCRKKHQGTCFWTPHNRNIFKSNIFKSI